MNGNPTLATSAMRTNLNLFSTFLIISFSIGLVRFRWLYKTFRSLTSFFLIFFERLNRPVCLPASDLNEGRGRWQAFFSIFFGIFLSSRTHLFEPILRAQPQVPIL